MFSTTSLQFRNTQNLGYTKKLQHHAENTRGTWAHPRNSAQKHQLNLDDAHPSI